MRILAWSILIAFSFLTVSVSAAVDCSEFLSSAPLSESEKQLTAGLSEPASSYVRLINFYAQKSSGQTIAQTLNLLIEAKEPINPFKDKVDSLSDQLSKAIKSVIGKITMQEWPQIQKALRQLIEQERAEQSDRDDKKEKTKDIFKPKLVQQFAFPNLGKATIPPKWHEVQGRKILLTTALGTIYLHELINGKLEFISEFNDEREQTIFDVSSQVIDGRIVFMSIGTRGLVRIYELKGKNLKHFGAVDLNLEVTSSPAWKVIGSRHYFAFSSLGRVHLFEFRGGNIKEVNSLEVPHYQHRPLRWQTIGKRNYLTFTAVDSVKGISFNLFEIIGRELVLKSSKLPGVPKPDIVRSDVLIGHDHFYPDAYITNKVHSLVIRNGILEEIISSSDKSDLKNVFLDEQNTVHTIVHMDFISIRNLKAGQIHEVSFFSDNAWRPGASIPYQGWINESGRIVLARADHLQNLVFYDLSAEGLLIKVGYVDLKGGMESNPQWIQDGQDTYIIVGVSDGFRLVKVFNP